MAKSGRKKLELTARVKLFTLIGILLLVINFFLMIGIGMKNAPPSNPPHRSPRDGGAEKAISLE